MEVDTVKRGIWLSTLVLLACGTVLRAAQINLKVTTDKSVYVAGDTVNWTMYAWSDPADNNAGVSLLAPYLTDESGETLSLPDTELYLGVTPQFTGTGYGAVEKFILERDGTVNDNTLVDMVVRQAAADKAYDIGNDGQERVFAQGSYTATIFGDHVLTPSKDAANHWNNPDAPNPDQSIAFDMGSTTAAAFSVTIPGDFNGDAIVNRDDLAIFLAAFETPDPGAPDMDGDNDCDRDDLAIWLGTFGDVAPTGSLGSAELLADQKMLGTETVPEPGTLLLLGTALAPLTYLTRRRMARPACRQR
ncbi:MAG: hypothetical protein AMS16_05630 [Planctomycetes bacterium DG_58]|nr:MAG: hypothetical protein AMS16_05630 [Planctomycetes bacterium DG_58]